MQYNVKVLHSDAFVSDEKYEDAQNDLMDNEFYIVSRDEYDVDFMVFAKEVG